MIKGVKNWSNDKDTAIQTIPTLLASLASILKYVNFILNMDKIKVLLFRMKKDYENIMYTTQMTLLESSSMYGRKITVFYTVFMLIVSSSYFVLPMTPVILDIVKPLNQSRERKYLFVSDYLIDMDKYYYYIMVHQCIGGMVVIDGLITLHPMFMVFVHHACSLFAIAGNQVKYLHILEDYHVDKQEAARLKEKYENKIYTEMEYEEMYRRLIFGIRIHKDAISFSDLIQSAYTNSIAVELGINLILLSFSGIQLVMNSTNADDIIRFIFLILGVLIHMLFLCFPGQRLIDYSMQQYRDT